MYSIATKITRIIQPKISIQKFTTVSSSAKNIVNSFLHGSDVNGTVLNETYSKLLSRGKSIHELVIHNVEPKAMDDYESLVKEFYPKLSNGKLENTIACKLFGSFKTEIGDLDQAGTGTIILVHIWEYDGYDEYYSANETLSKNENYAKFMKSLRPMLRSRESQVVLEFAFWNATIPYDTNSIYELRSYLLKPGRLLEWEQGWRQGLEARKQFVEPVGAWFSQLGQLNYVHHMWAYPSLQHRKKMREKTWKVKGWGESVKKTVGLIDHMQSRILKPLVLNKKPQ